MRNPFRLRFRWQLVLSFLPLLLIPMLIVSVVTRRATEYGLIVLGAQEGRRRANDLVPAFTSYYNLYGTWENIGVALAGVFKSPQEGQNPQSFPPGQQARPPGQQAINPQQPRFPPVFPRFDEVILANAKGVVIASDKEEVIGQTLSVETLSYGVPIYSKGQFVGTVVVGAALGTLDQQQRELLDTLNTALLLSGVLSAAVTILIGVWLSGRITAPVKHLMQGVKTLASGKWAEPLPVRQRDEFGDLTSAFNTMAEEMIKQQRLRRQMVADIAHDLRTPLSVMALEVEAIREGLQTPAEAATSLQEEIEWLQRLVNDLHTLSMIDANQMHLQMEPTDLNVFLASVGNHWQAMATKENRNLRVEIPARLPIVCLDPHRMRQVLGNLLGNAFQHTPRGASIMLYVEGHRERIAISVIDSGQGIAPDILPHIFERFYRGDRSRHRARSDKSGSNGTAHGSGLGLSIAYQLAALQGGELTVRSTPGHGTTFTVHLPVYSGGCYPAA